MKNLPEVIPFTKKTFFLPRNVQLRTFVDKRQHFFGIKRTVDIILSSIIVLFILSWLFPLIALLIKMDSAGPVFFIQRRVGRGGRTFRCLKFRTMIVNGEANDSQAEENDARITRIGSFLRKSNLDEFPQFLNVLTGNMSIVGPRPHMHSDCDKFSQVIPGYKFRNMVKPGITGLAQIKGYRGPTKDFESMFRRYQYDSYYIRNANIWLDMRIVRQTAYQTIYLLWLRLITKENEVRARFKKLASTFRG
ncbi:MAG TPA: sugar transferase [Flavitalea sp.]|nr:sugar transferase [Flavitalea sp.]